MKEKDMRNIQKWLLKRKNDALKRKRACMEDPQHVEWAYMNRGAVLAYQESADYLKRKLKKMERAK